ncbi:MAG: DNA cytosine methyltransferase [Chloroflexota bacterium]|nr:DNA cytosine methyltransferase [Chloroflexota bacterium]
MGRNPSGLTHVGYADRAGLAVPADAGVAALDAAGQPLPLHGTTGTSLGGVLYPAPARLTFIDVFCGCGGASLGFLNAGMEGLAAIDLDLWALATYWHNLCGPGSRWIGEGGIVREGRGKTRVPDDIRPGNGHFDRPWLELPDADEAEPRQMPVRNLIRRDVADLGADELLRIVGLPPGAVTMMHGSPPCQGFSVANSRRFIDDPRNALYREFIRLVAGVKPIHVSIENVPAMLTFGDAWLHIQEDLSALGYRVGCKILDACAYGVPQFRPRAIVSANRGALDPWWPVPTNWGDKDLEAFDRFPALLAEVRASATLTADPQPTELCIVTPTSGDRGPYLARLAARDGNRAKLTDPFGGKHDVMWTTVLGFGAHTRRQRSLFDSFATASAAAGGGRS